ncbi:MAG: hypothetical protein WBV70_02680 [Candidatus Bathyarchaeia archaeon]
MEKLVRILSIISLITLISVPSVLACLWVEGKVDRQYSLSLAATQRFSTITLTAHLTLREERHKTEDVAGAIIHFYSCNSKGHIIKELGKCTTKKDGTATFSWSATHNGDYWFVAEYVSNTSEKYDGHS